MEVEVADADEIERREAFTAFMATRVEINPRLNKNQKKQAAGKNLNYNKCDEITRAGLDAARKAEWEKWKHFEAGSILTSDKAIELMREGHKVIPTQWIKVDKNAHLKTSGDYTGPEFNPDS